MGVIFGTLFVFIGIISVIVIVVESVEMYYDIKCRFKNED